METARCLSRLQKLCSKAEYCEADIYRKALKDLDGDADVARKVVEALTKEKYVDNARYASAFAREKATIQGWGPVKIRFQLKAKGISEEVIRAALEEVDEEKQADKLQKVLQAKARTLTGDPQFRLKLLRFGLTRGYDYDAVEAEVSKIIATFAAEK
ncbi:MAG: RecX family transcriptional regulator [Bacteroidales bacterium]|nr:RecX family transcriptional regulator [Bacteroidales bacterium]MBQ9701634.1 RecX family transcriptional regulator [Bacteroidales bacterium]MBR1783087.1 RecX family transcriptional regulator [Bacteroidales bacterium]